jgi:hypothetical protein
MQTPESILVASSKALAVMRQTDPQHYKTGSPVYRWVFCHRGKRVAGVQGEAAGIFKPFSAIALLWGADNARSIIVISMSAGLLPKPSRWVMNSHQGVDRGKTWVSMLRVCDSCSPLNVMASHLKAR